MSRKVYCMLLIGLLLAMTGSASAAVIKGKVLVEYWFGGGIDNVMANFKANADFNNPADAGLLNAMDLPDQPAWDYWGARLRAWLTPPQSGDYTFWTMSDDDSELWLSTDDTAANAKMICNVSGWGGYQDWTGTTGAPGTTFKSAPVTLEAGKRYYIESLFCDGTGGGFVSVAWAGPDIGDAPTVISGAYLEAQPSEMMYIAKSPSPANGEVDVVAPLFQWTAGTNAKIDDIYFGTSPDLGAADFQGKQPSAMALFFYPGILEPGVKYYWRVDTTDTSNVLHKGKVWSFTVMPVKATEPSPADGASWLVRKQILSWKAGQNAPTHDLYFGTDKALVTAGDASVFKGNLVDATFDPNILLDASTTYYWRVDEIDATGMKFEGDVWSFTTTLPGLGAAKRQIWWNVGGTAVSDLLNDPNFPLSPDVTDEVAEFRTPPNIGDNYGGRLAAWLHVPVAGEYTFWVASDDNSQLFFGTHPGKAKVIASVSSWTDDQAWDWYAEQKSEKMTLQAGVYYIEALWKEGGGGDNCSAAWEGPGLPRQLIGGGYLEPFSDLWAVRPSPADGATGVFFTITLKWGASAKATGHDVYLGTSESAVASADTKSKLYKGRVAQASFNPGDLQLGQTYYWRVDEVNDAAADSPWKGAVWSFKVSDYSLIDDFEAYEFLPVAPKSPLGWWKFDGDAKDSSGKGHNGIENGGPVYGDGVSGKAIQMDGVDDFIVVGSVGISGTMPRTIAGWVKADTTNIVDWTNIFGFTSTPDGGCDLSFDIDKIGGANQYCIHCYCFEIGYVDIDLEWHHMAATYDGTTIRWYAEGLLRGSQARVINTQDNVQMGKRGHAAGGNWPGSIDDVRIYNYALSELEMKSLAGYVPAHVLSDAWKGTGPVALSLATVAHGGNQALRIDYDTFVLPCEGQANVAPPYADLTRGGANAISLWVRGNAKNAPNWLFLTLKDTAGASCKWKYKDMTGLNNGEWANWVVPFSMIDVNEKSVSKISIGASAGQAGDGTFYIDDIRLIKQ